MADDVALHFGEGRVDLQEGSTDRSRGVHRGVQRPERDAATVEVVYERDEFAGKPAQATEIQDDEDIALAHVVDVGREIRAFRRGAVGAVVEKSITSSRVQRVELAIEHQATFGRGDSRVSNESRDGALPKTCDGPSYRSWIMAGFS